ncbi:MAG: hypothetical protein ABSE69_05035 [Roseiarcus sp.]
MTESFRKRETLESTLLPFALLLGGVFVLPGRPSSEWAFFGAAVLIAVVLFEIRGKLEAIRFMLAHDFEEKIDRAEASRSARFDR